MGHLHAHRGDRFVTISTWIGRHAIETAERSSLYRETVDALEATGILRGSSTVDVFDIDGLNLGWESRRAAQDDYED